MYREQEIIDTAILGLEEYYPNILRIMNKFNLINKVVVPNTGNEQADYEMTRDQIENLVSKYM